MATWAVCPSQTVLVAISQTNNIHTQTLTSTDTYMHTHTHAEDSYIHTFLRTFKMLFSLLWMPFSKNPPKLITFFKFPSKLHFLNKIFSGKPITGLWGLSLNHPQTALALFVTNSRQKNVCMLVKTKVLGEGASIKIWDTKDFNPLYTSFSVEVSQSVASFRELRGHDIKTEGVMEFILKRFLDSSGLVCLHWKISLRPTYFLRI